MRAGVNVDFLSSSPSDLIRGSMRRRSGFNGRERSVSLAEPHLIMDSRVKPENDEVGLAGGDRPSTVTPVKTGV